MESRQKKLSHTRLSYPAILVVVLVQAGGTVSSALAAPVVANGNFDLGGNQWTVNVPPTANPWQASFPATGGNPSGFARIQSPFGDSTGGVATAEGGIRQVLGCTADTPAGCEIIFDYKLDWFDATSGFDSGRIVARVNGALVFVSAHNLSETNPGTPWTTVTLQAPACDPSNFITLQLVLEVDLGDNAWVASFDNVRVNCDGISGGDEDSQYVRGDSNTDGVMDLSDPQTTMAYLFRNGPRPTCMSAADANGDGEVDLSDAIYGLSFSFRGGPAPPHPFRKCGVGERDSLGCAVYELCPPAPPVLNPGNPCRDIDEEDMFSAAATRITFDDEEGRALHEVVVNQYQALGVRFTDDSVKTPLIVDDAIRGATTASPEYSLYNDNDFPASSSGVPMEIRFTSLVQRVGMYIGNGNNSGGVHATLTAYDVSNTSTCSITRFDIPDGVHAFIGMDVGSALIERVELDYGATLNGEEIDTLMFE